MSDDARTIATHVRLSPRAMAWLKARSKELDRPISYLVARIIDDRIAAEQQTKKGTKS